MPIINSLSESACGRGRSLLLPPMEYQIGISTEILIEILVVAGANSCHGLGPTWAGVNK